MTPEEIIQLVANAKHSLAEIRAEEANASIGLAFRCDEAEEAIDALMGCLRAAPQAVAMSAFDELRRTLCGVGIVGRIDGFEVIRRESVIELVDDRRKKLEGGQSHA